MSTTRKGSRLENDDPYYCKKCGDELPKMLVDGPIAGDGTEHPPVELCGDCKGEQMRAIANAEL